MEGYEPLESFEAALDQEAARMASPQFRRECPQYFPDYQYFNTGRYGEQVTRYLDIFGPEAVKVCLFDDLVRQPVELYASICTFLGLTPRATLAPVAKNVSVLPKSIARQYRLRAFQRWWQRRLGRASKPITLLADAAMKANVAAGTKIPMPESAGRTLAGLYRDDVSSLSALLGRDLSHWLQA